MTIDRRRFFLETGVSLSAALLAACNSKGPDSARRLLRYAERKNEALERALFRHTSMSHTAAPIARANALPSYYVSREVPRWDEAVRGAWSLDVTGLVARPMRLSLDDLMRLPRITQRVPHYCVEGWTATVEWTGVRLRDVARLVGARAEATYVDFRSFDDGYHESWDRESAEHPQTLIVYGQDGHLLGMGHGAPARVHSPVKLGYKNTKYLTSVVFMAKRNGGYWSDEGYEWYGGT